MATADAGMQVMQLEDKDGRPRSPVTQKTWIKNLEKAMLEDQMALDQLTSGREQGLAQFLAWMFLNYAQANELLGIDEDLKNTKLDAMATEKATEELAGTNAGLKNSKLDAMATEQAVRRRRLKSLAVKELEEKRAEVCKSLTDKEGAAVTVKRWRFGALNPSLDRVTNRFQAIEVKQVCAQKDQDGALSEATEELVASRRVLSKSCFTSWLVGDPEFYWMEPLALKFMRHLDSDWSHYEADCDFL